MIVLRARNVARALPKALSLLEEIGVRRPSRAGPVLMSPEPVATVYERPTERVMHHRFRDANPFFHAIEPCWMLAGRRDVAPIARYVKRMAQFSDDGRVLNGSAYGWRLRRTAGDQLIAAIRKLRRDRDDRRVVLAMHEPRMDTWTDPEFMTGEESESLYFGKDAACNLTATLQIGLDGRLDLVVFCRSNDIIWGCYGANAVHFSTIQEYVARHVGVEIGTYTQISVNWHAYEDVFRRTLDAMRTDSEVDRERYGVQGCAPVSVVSPGVSREEWDSDCRNLMDGRLSEFRDPWFRDVMAPMVRAHDCLRDHERLGREQSFVHALRELEACVAVDWRTACWEWVTRRWNNWRESVDG